MPLPARVLLLLALWALMREAASDSVTVSVKSADLAAKACSLVKGEWCKQYYSLPWQPFKPVPRGDKPCPKDCNGVGNCNHDSGLCECPAGWTGDDCTQPLKRPCTNRLSDPDDMPPLSHIDGNGRDLNVTAPGWTPGRCGGYCDDVYGTCWCDSRSKYGRRNHKASYNSRNLGRPLADDCHLGFDVDGNKLNWGWKAYDEIYGPTGWCNADKPVFPSKCGCPWDGQAGPGCDENREMFCLNQCSGHGECVVGFCKCHEGWYGVDCSRKRAGQAMEPGRAEKERPWLKLYTTLPPAARQHGEQQAGEEEDYFSDKQPEQPKLQAKQQRRKRPFIYVYDMEPVYTTLMLQYRINYNQCVWRQFGDRNESIIQFNNYYVETLLHELLLRSQHRTFDPEEADFFYVPVYSSCFIYPIFAYNDWPWFGAPRGPRVSHAAMMTLQAKRWVQQHFPYWNRTNGADHIWLFTHDEGACWAPSEVANTSILLTHWGRMDKDHTSNTGYSADNYTKEHTHPVLRPDGWLKYIQGHPCYDPAKDLVVPVFKPPRTLAHSTYITSLGQDAAGQPPAAAGHQNATPAGRDILCFFRGEMAKHRRKDTPYSRRIRQRLYQLWVERGWREEHKILIGDGKDIVGEYGELLGRSKYCLVLPGDGWSARAEDAVLHGCVPVVIMDGVHSIFESILDWDAFGLRVAQDQLEQLPQLLQAVTPERLAAMQAALAKVWHRFTWFSHPAIRQQLSTVSGVNLGDGSSAMRLRDELQNDAFHTIMQWLAGRMEKGGDS